MNTRKEYNIFEIIYDPYKIDEGDTFDEIYKRYLDDDSKTRQINGTTYYKAARITRITTKQRTVR